MAAFSFCYTPRTLQRRCQMAEIKIVRAEKSETVWAKEIVQLIKPEARSSLMLAWKEEEIKRGIERGDAILAFQNGQVVGHVRLVIWKRYVEIAALIVAPQERGKHLGTNLMREGIDLAREKYPRKEIILLPNEASFHIGAQLGFSECEKNYFDGEIWEACQNCLEFPRFPICHCHPMVLKKCN